VAKSTAPQANRQHLRRPQIPIDPSLRTAKASRPAISCLGASRTPPLADHHPRHPAGRPRNLHKSCRLDEANANGIFGLFRL
jgi:hypothetical protein